MIRFLAALLALILSVGVADAEYAGKKSAVPVGNASSDAAASTVQTSIGAVADQLNYLVFAQCRGSGATASSTIVGTVTGLLGGTLSIPVTVPTIAAGGDWTAALSVPTGWPASGVNVAIVIQVPSAGAGNLHAACSILGYRLPASQF